MKIGIVGSTLNPHSGARAPIELAKHISKHKNQVTLYTTNTVMCRFLPDLELFKKIKKDRPELVIFAGTLSSFLSCFLARVKIVRIYMGTQFNAYLERFPPGQNLSLNAYVLNFLGNIYIRLVEFFMIHTSYKVIGISHYVSREAERLYKRKVDKTIYLGGNHLPWVKSSLKRKHPLNLISVSRITPYKGFHYLIKLVEELGTDVRLTIVGTVVNKAYFRYLKTKTGDNVSFVINPDDKKLAKLYSLSDLYLSADKFLFFGFPIVEAASFGKPAVALNFAAAAEMIVHGKTGFVAKDMGEMTYYLKLLIENPTLRKKLGSNAKIRAKNFSWERCAKKYEKVIKKILH